MLERLLHTSLDAEMEFLKFEGMLVVAVLGP